MAKGIKIPIFWKTHGRAAKRLFRVFWDLEGNKHVASVGGNKVSDDSEELFLAPRLDVLRFPQTQ